jgi:type I restriction enzyme R subunit
MTSDFTLGGLIRKVIAEGIPTKVAADKAYQNAMKRSDRQNARNEHDRALHQRVLVELADHHGAVQAVQRQCRVQKWLADTVFSVMYNPLVT